MGNIILAFVFIGIGLGNLVNWSVIWALILIALGVVILLRAMGWRI
jgi:low affinity Fe/Cu permease